MGYKVAVVGATGMVGREMLTILAEREFPASEVVPLASRRSIGKEVSYGERTLKTLALENFDFKGTHIALFSAAIPCRRNGRPKAAAAGAVVIDNSSHFRMHADVPLVVPEVNAAALWPVTPNAASLPIRTVRPRNLVVALKPLHDVAKIRRVVVATYQSVSGAGNQGADELFRQTRAVFVSDPDREIEIHQADRLQPDSAHRQLHGRRLHERRMEDDGRNKKNA